MHPRSGHEPRALRLKELRPVLVGVAFALAFTLGVVGYREAEPALDLSTAAFKSIQLFVLEGGVVEGETPWPLEIARWLAPAVVGYAAIRGAMLLARDQLTTWRTRLFTRGHVLILGNSSAVAVLTDGLLRAGRTVVVVTTTPALLTGHRERGAAIIEGDPRDSVVAARGRPDRAQDVVITYERDADALRALAACENVVGAERGPAIHVGLNEPRLWEELHSVGLASAARMRSIEFFLAADREARILLDGLTSPVLLVEGRGVVLERLVVAAGRAALLDGRQLALTFGPRARESRSEILQRSPWLAEAVAITDEVRAPFAAVVAGLGDAAGIAYGAQVARTNPASTVRVAVADEAVEEALAASRLSEPNLDLVPTRGLALGPALLSDSAIDILARAKHEDYVAREKTRGVTLDQNPSIVAWHELPPSLQLSNRRFAESVAKKLEDIGATLTPLAPTSTTGDLGLPAATLEDLAQEEHDRWMRDLVADGWRATEGEKDPHAKLHPLLVPWEELDESEREKDRDGFRALPRLMARAGYELTRPTDGAGG